MAVVRSNSLLLLQRADVAELLDLESCIDAVETALVAEAMGRAGPAALLSVHAQDGGFHVKAACLNAGRPVFAAKINGNFPSNPRRHSLPTIQGVVVLADAANGVPLAVMDSIEITITRTAAATALAARHLARPDARQAAIIGCGAQGRAQLRALASALPLRCAHAFDQNAATALDFARELGAELNLDIAVAATPEMALRTSDVVATCTPARKWFIGAAETRPGTFIAAIGADSGDKQELEPALVASATLVLDAPDQCADIGELHHAVAAGLIPRARAHRTLGQVAAGLVAGRTRPDEIIVFDSTGTALEDVAAAALIYDKAVRTGRGTFLNFAD